MIAFSYAAVAVSSERCDFVSDFQNVLPRRVRKKHTRARYVYANLSHQHLPVPKLKLFFLLIVRRALVSRIDPREGRELRRNTDETVFLHLYAM
jgi:hypothetical protein